LLSSSSLFIGIFFKLKCFLEKREEKLQLQGAINILDVPKLNSKTKTKKI
jgi:hypothetical protein